MPITRRKRVNPPEQPENNNHVAEQSTEGAPEAAAERASERTQPGEGQGSEQTGGQTGGQTTAPVASTASAPPAPVSGGTTESPAAPYQPFAPTLPPSVGGTNGERKESVEKPERVSRSERHDYTPTIEGGRRTSRGELFRRPPQPPAQQPLPASVTQPAPQAPSREISLPLGNLLHLAYNPGYTGSDEARSQLLEQLANESKAGGRARCWSCGSIAIVYDRWNTRSKTFGEVGVAFCEICGVWSVM